MSTMNRFFSYSLDGFELHETADEAKSAAYDALELWTDGEFTEGYLNICWGEVHGMVHEEILHHHGPECEGEDGCPEGYHGVGEHDYVAECSIVELPSDPKMKRMRAELATFRARVGAAIAVIREMEAHHRQAVSSPAHGRYNFERAEAYEHAADLLERATEANHDA